MMQTQSSRRGASKVSATADKKDMIQLDRDFEPGPNDVICGGRNEKKAFNHNHHFHKIIEDHIEPYLQCQSRIHRSILFGRIVSMVRKRSPRGGFVRYSHENQCYFQIGSHAAREKVGQALRKICRRRQNNKKQLGASCQKQDTNRSASAPGVPTDVLLGIQVTTTAQQNNHDSIPSSPFGHLT